MSENQEKQVSAVPTDAVVAYLSDIYRQLDAISIRIVTGKQIGRAHV